MKYSIIPRPVKYEVKEETVEVSNCTAITCVKEFVSVGNMLSDYLKTRKDADDGEIVISKAKSIAMEGYALYTQEGKIFIKSSTLTGAYHAFITLKWILMQAKKKDGKKILDGFLIEDKPYYKHRGIMLDECRHFFGIDFVKNLLDNMAMLKMNVFHWHLSDDQGFRIESKAFPLLNEIGSSRKSASLKLPYSTNNTGEKYGPFYYTQDEICEIVSYARERSIEIIPEIDIPGHCTAIIAAYPNYGCNGEKVDVAVTTGIHKQILCAGNDDTFDFLYRLFGEICPLFDGEYFHIGGDETKYTYWKKCPDCNRRMKDNNLKKYRDLQIYFMNRVEKIINSYGKKCIAWNDCLGKGLNESIVCQNWNSKNKAELKKQATKREIILSPMMNFYFDMKYKVVSTEKVYKFNEKAYGFGKNDMKIRGVEAELWTEWIDSVEAAHYSIYPRIAALAEVGWTKFERRNLKDFNKRLNFYKLYLKLSGLNFYSLKKRKIAFPSLIIYSFGANGKEFKHNEKAKKSGK